MKQKNITTSGWIVTDLELGTGVPGVMMISDEGRIAAVMGQVYLINMATGDKVDRIGSRDTQALDVVSLHWGAQDRSITFCSPISMMRWRAERPE